MSYPAPPGLKTSSNSTTPVPPPSLPARPPTSAATATFKPAFTAFAPRSVASANTYRTSSPAHYAAAPTPIVSTYSPAATTAVPAAAPATSSYYASQPAQYDSSSYSAPQIRNPFVPPPPATTTTPDITSSATSYPGSYDPDYEAQVQQWQSAYMNRGDTHAPTSTSTTSSALKPTTNAASSTAASTTQAGTATSTTTNTTTSSDGVVKTVHRSGGGTQWTDPTLLEWDPAHFRIFVGNLAGEVTDESLLKAFSQYPSVQKARVIRDKRTNKSKGYGFVSFANGDDYFRAAREQNGKYVGSHPIIIKKAVTDVRPSIQKQNTNSNNRYQKNKHKDGAAGPGGHAKVQHGGVNKKQPKTKGGLKVLG
ncbi:hypothetical protein HRR83_009447 [Exophiala dermatitidis]|uniref:RRM domain-containing protein n=2 Tax=Exophiala dermatitidis TaxID=5970 RepID=H6C2P0_EXODN|nr:uncharacterized protein HMPREF1120_05978 [Exophiala dermatitidis NIH/UT8656]KAJ4501974.1 hypothetical protein HRR75_008747 [Exophiala dermatitidis]EHY57958.1 hypothetical protein HMPREF1120_05978 [Exophiala dermatitidis NIH/UT8656]KAJ4502284.1 hypothetical protein HRR73_009494 [Exophiala dermatitidis]KAJ4502749.1 hypothetical protein HRR74_009506 [Exophiala dermatitidis]KAJ4531443.1 hypothetical protein HRR77_009478 [Exophiala dermatitidis]